MGQGQVPVSFSTVAFTPASRMRDVSALAALLDVARPFVVAPVGVASTLVAFTTVPNRLGFQGMAVGRPAT